MTKNYGIAIEILHDKTAYGGFNYYKIIRNRRIMGNKRNTRLIELKKKRLCSCLAMLYGVSVSN